MSKIRKKSRHPNIQSPPVIYFGIPAGHKSIKIKVIQDNGTAIDKDEAINILRTKPYASGIISKLRYCGVTSVYHVFSYPE